MWVMRSPSRSRCSVAGAWDAADVGPGEVGADCPEPACGRCEESDADDSVADSAAKGRVAGFPELAGVTGS